MKRAASGVGLATAFLLSACATAPTGPSVMVLPGSGRSFSQFQADDALCRQWAAQQTGFDPSQPVEQSVPRHSAMRGAARGAALGAVGGAIGGDAGKGAAVGAAVGGLGTVMRDRRANEEQQQAYSASTQSYDRAYGACLRGRGYTVN